MLAAAGRKTGLIMTNTRKRHTPEQVVRKLGQADRMLADGADVAAVCRELGVSEQTYYRWRNQYGGMKANERNCQYLWIGVFQATSVPVC